MTPALKNRLEEVYERHTEESIRRAFVDRTADELFLSITIVAYQSRYGRRLEIDDNNRLHFVWTGYLIAVDNQLYLPGEWR